MKRKPLVVSILVVVITISLFLNANTLRISTYAQPLPDINGDGVINILDICLVAIAFGTAEGDEKYNAVADLNGDKKINIEDVALIAKDFGKKYVDLTNFMGRGLFSTNLPPIALRINAPQYSLPIDLNKVRGLEEITKLFSLTPEQEQLLSQNGFVVLRVNRFEILAQFYELAYHAGLPILITTDAVLHTYHVLFDEALKQIEIAEFISLLNNTLGILLTKAEEHAALFAHTPLEIASKLNLMYCEVARALIQPSFQPSTPEAQQELELISNHNRIGFSPIFGYREDYTQYVPRGHYTENGKLEMYFKTMMWLGRMRFALLTDNVINVEQTRAGILLTWMVTQNPEIYAVWQRIYEITKFFVGVSDDLTFEDYLAVLDEKEVITPEQLYDGSTIVSIARELLNRNRAKILGTYSETYPWLPQEEELQRILNETAGLRFMGQRFIPDSYMFQQLVYPQVGTWTHPRLLPKGLDVPSVLGSDLAKQILEKTEAVYKNYVEQVEKLRKEFAGLSVMNWTRNLYWTWLYTAKTTLQEIPSEAKYPTFMKTQAWSYEKLQTFLGTWTELRHDTILYAKQSYTPFLVWVPPCQIGYVEPYPETYRRMIGLINMTINGLTQFNVLSPTLRESLASFLDISKLFLNASIIELENGALDLNMQKQVRNAALTISAILSGASEKAQKAAIIADVHTDPNTKKVLEEALGNFNILIIVYADADGTLYSATGPVYNYFEFTWPMSDRLTDEKWREMLANNEVPEPPEWTNNFAR
ncbi:MAG: DUF3160 domain-containing protein [Candidatus Bathyarchaeia archaeon]